jgi:hypothetical protein
MLGDIEVTFDLATVFEDFSGAVADDQFVEVAGTLDVDTVLALRIELEDEGFSDSGSISLEGIVTNFSGLNSFFVSGQEVNASAASVSFSPASLAASLGDDQHIEVEGEIIAGVLVATGVEQRQGDITIAGLVVGNVGDGTLDIEVVSGQPSISVSTDAQTQLEDEQLELSLTLADLAIDVDEVVIEGYLDDVGNVIAAQIKRRVLEKYELEGPVEVASGNALFGNVTILGVTMQTNDSTVFENASDADIGGDVFYGQNRVGELVKIVDKDEDQDMAKVQGDGIADEVELSN